MKRNAIIRIILFSLVIVILLGLLLTGILADRLSFDGHFFGIRYDEKIEDGTISSTGTVDADQITDITIEWIAGTIRIQPGDVTQITFSETAAENNDHPMVWKQSGNELILRYSDESVSLSGFGATIKADAKKDLTITVPRDWECGELSLAVASANVEVTDMTIDEVDFDGASGLCEFENCTVSELSVDTASGDINYSGWLDVFDCDAASADCVIEVTNTPSRIDLDSMSGDLELFLPEDCGFTVTMDALSSDFSSEFPVTRANDTYVFGSGECRISVDAMSGDVNIRKAQSAPNNTF